MSDRPSPTSKPDPGVVLDLIEAFRRSKTMFAAVELGVIDALETNGPATLPELADRLACSADGLERLLDACVGLGLLVKTRRDAGSGSESESESVSEGGSKVVHEYANAPVASTYLTSVSPDRLTGYVRFSNSVVWNLWTRLEDAVREGSNRWKQVHGWDGPIFDHFFRTEESKREFLMGMHGFGVISSPKVARAFDLSRFRTIVDLGGATGHLAIAACEANPGMKGVVFDLPEAVPLAREVVGASSVADRVEVRDGDFFADPLPAGDLYAVGRILHDWTVEKIERLLRRVFEALPPGGGLLIAEKLLEPEKTGPRWALMQSLNMLTCTEGKERSLDEYARLLRSVGFVDVEGRTTDSPLDAVLALKPA